MFEKYFPPKDNTDARIKEIKNIRNRIMHFREPHENDVARVLLFLKDFEPGVRLFCQTYLNDCVSKEEKTLVKLLADHWDRIGYGVELEYLRRGHLFAPQPHNIRKVSARLSLIRRPWTTVEGEGLLYKISVSTLSSFEDGYRVLDFEEMLRRTKELHDKCVHISIYCTGEFKAIFPAHLGDETNFNIISAILSAAINCPVRSKIREHEIERLSRLTPEYVLWPNSPMFWYDDSMTDSLFILE